MGEKFFRLEALLDTLSQVYSYVFLFLFAEGENALKIFLRRTVAFPSTFLERPCSVLLLSCFFL
jgi:hypothetical protein